LIEILFVSEDDDALDMLLIHEISHAVASLGHGKTWQRRLALAAATARKLGRVRLAELLDTEIDNYQNRGEGLPEIYAEVRDALLYNPDLTLTQIKRWLAQVHGLHVGEVCKVFRGLRTVYEKGRKEGMEFRQDREKEGMAVVMKEDLDDFFTDDLLTEKKKRKKRKADGKKKGNRVELSLSKILNERFGGGFSRSVGSGNRWGQVSSLPKHAQEVFSGDLIVPQGFKWAVESKGGYDIDLHSVFVGGSKELDGFLEQVTRDSERCGRKPMLCWKRDRKPWVAFVPTKELNGHAFKYRLVYKEWSAVALKTLLQMPDQWFLKEGNSNAIQA
jgi:hypothetical protein